MRQIREIAFYETLGTELDEEGNPYPLLYMKKTEGNA